MEQSLQPNVANSMRNVRVCYRVAWEIAQGCSVEALRSWVVRVFHYLRAWLTVCIGLGLILSGCHGRMQEPPVLPNTDIVFQHYPVTQMLGFVNADGTGFTELELVEKGGGIPTWSSNGRQILYRWGPPDYPSRSRAYIAVGGLRICKKSDLWGVGRPHPVPQQDDLVLTPIDWTGGVRDKPTVSLVDPLTCEVVKDVYQHEPVESGDGADIILVQPALSVDDLLAVGLWTFERSISYTRILVVDLTTGDEVEVGEGVGMTWSPDGEWLAYTQPHGIMIVRPDGTEKRRVLAEGFDHQRVPLPADGSVWWNWPPYPEWSSDGKWLLFHLWDGRQFNIYKLNVETEETQLVIENGVYPHWRW